MQSKGACQSQKAQQVLADGYNRPVTSMRISVTQRCNLNCQYCHREGQAPSSLEMSPQEIAKIASIGENFGIAHLKITGGEPLVREDIVEIVKRLPVSDISLTTNGLLLEPLAESLAKAGLRRVNMGCESSPKFGSIKGGLEAAKNAGLPVKLNMVVMRGINEHEVGRMVGICRDSGASLQLIELIETKNNRDFYRKHRLSLQAIEEDIAKRSASVVSRALHARRQYAVEGVTVEIVRPMHNTRFCGNCSRIRVTSDGLLKPCLMSNDNCVDILTPLRQKLPDERLENIFAGACRARIPYWRNG